MPNNNLFAAEESIRQPEKPHCNEKLFYTISEASNQTGLSSYYLRQGIREGWIPHIKCGNKAMINMRLFLSILNKNSQGGEDNAQQ